MSDDIEQMKAAARAMIRRWLDEDADTTSVQEPLPDPPPVTLRAAPAACPDCVAWQAEALQLTPGATHVCYVREISSQKAEIAKLRKALQEMILLARDVL